MSSQYALPDMTVKRGGAIGGSEGGSGGDAGGGIDGGIDGGYGAVVPQMVKPAMVAEPSVYQYIVSPSVMLTSAGPVAPTYLVPLIKM